jgi:hypothetical protein
VARNILSDRLRRLVEAGILATQPASDGSAYQEYVLTAQGKRLFPVVVALRQWGERHLFGPDERHSWLIDKKTGTPVAFMAPLTGDGRVLSPDEAEVSKSADGRKPADGRKSTEGRKSTDGRKATAGRKSTDRRN